MTAQTIEEDERAGAAGVRPVLQARGLVKRYGHVTALDGCDFELRPGEILAVIGDNGAGKSSLIKALSGALTPDSGELLLDGERVRFHGPADARRAGIETVYQDLAVAPALDIASNLFLGREKRRKGVLGSVFRMLDRDRMQDEAAGHMAELKIGIRSMKQTVETLSGGQRQGVAVARSAAFARHVVIMDEPTAALGVKETGMVLDLIRQVRERGLPVVLISHDMPAVFDVADRVHVQRLGRRVAVVRPGEIGMSDAVAIMTGAAPGNLAGGNLASGSPARGGVVGGDRAGGDSATGRPARGDIADRDRARGGSVSGSPAGGTMAGGDSASDSPARADLADGDPARGDLAAG